VRVTLFSAYIFYTRSVESSIDQLWRYNDWANGKVLATLADTGEGVPHRCIQLISHIINAQLIWIDRIVGNRLDVGVWEEHSLEDCQSLHEFCSDAMSKMLLESEPDLKGMVRSINTKGELFSNLVQDILLHIFNHGTYHWAQIATELRINGLEPDNTDYITLCKTSGKLYMIRPFLSLCPLPTTFRSYDQRYSEPSII